MKIGIVFHNVTAWTAAACKTALERKQYENWVRWKRAQRKANVPSSFGDKGCHCGANVSQCLG
jgi:hypothetical protein